MDLKTSEIPPPPHCRGPGHLPLDHVGQGLTRTGLKHCRARGIRNLPVLFHPFQCFTTVIVNIFSQLSNLNFPSFNLYPLLLVLSLQFLTKSPSTASL